MCSFRDVRAALAVVLALATSWAWGQPREFPGIGRAATASEIAAWDIDVRPDFKGLPKGRGSVAQGQDIWEAKCASCHGVFGESNEVFSPLVGGTTAEDVKTGRVARLLDPSFPGRTTLMKVSTLSTLWDYIHRAMPWNAPKSLKPDEVYAVTAFLLNLGGVVGDDYVLSDANMAQTQARLPNRNGMTTRHALWPGRPAPKVMPDVRASACMTNCEAEPKHASLLPDYARSAHGNLAEQNRPVGAQHGANTAAGAAVAAAASPATPSVAALLGKYTCTGCHRNEGKLVGPGFGDAGKRHRARPDALEYLAGKIRSGGSGVWGDVPMPPQTLPDTDARRIAQWILEGAKP
jgi:cytochrome c551/c552